MKKIVSRLCLVLIVLLGILSSGCGSNDNQALNSKILYSVTDSQGYKIDFPNKPERIVSLSISTDEILLKLVPAKKIVALTYLADDPGISNVVALAKEVPNRIDKNSTEYILALNPDLVIVPDFVKPEMITSLRDMGLNVYVYKTPSSFEEVKKSILEMGNLVGEEDKAKVLVEEMDEKVNKVSKILGKIPQEQQKRVAFMRDNGVYYSPHSSFRSICDYAQVYDITKDIHENHSFVLASEQIIKLNPQGFVIDDWNYDGKHSTQEQIDNILSNRAYQDTIAWKKKDIIVLPASKVLALSPSMADAILLLAEKAYPEKFK